MHERLHLEQALYRNFFNQLVALFGSRVFAQIEGVGQRERMDPHAVKSFVVHLAVMQLNELLGGDYVQKSESVPRVGPEKEAVIRREFLMCHFLARDILETESVRKALESQCLDFGCTNVEASEFVAEFCDDARLREAVLNDRGIVNLCSTD